MTEENEQESEKEISQIEDLPATEEQLETVTAGDGQLTATTVLAWARLSK